MGKKYRDMKAREAEVAEEIKKFVEENGQEKMEETPVAEVYEEPEEIIFEEKTIYDQECECMLEKIKDTVDTDDQAKRLENLKKMSEIAKIMSEKRIAHRNAEIAEERQDLERQKLEMEKITREEELKLKSEEVKAVKRNGIVGNAVSILGTIVSFVCYGALMARQNEFEKSGETITSASGRDLSRHAFDFGRMFRKG